MKGVVIRTPAGYMVLGESINNDESEITNETVGTNKRKYRAEYLKSTVRGAWVFCGRYSNGQKPPARSWEQKCCSQCW